MTCYPFSFRAAGCPFKPDDRCLEDLTDLLKAFFYTLKPAFLPICQYSVGKWVYWGKTNYFANGNGNVSSLFGPGPDLMQWSIMVVKPSSTCTVCDFIHEEGVWQETDAVLLI